MCTGHLWRQLEFGTRKLPGGCYDVGLVGLFIVKAERLLEEGLKIHFPCNPTT